MGEYFGLLEKNILEKLGNKLVTSVTNLGRRWRILWRTWGNKKAMPVNIPGCLVNTPNCVACIMKNKASNLY